MSEHHSSVLVVSDGVPSLGPMSRIEVLGRDGRLPQSSAPAAGARTYCSGRLQRFGYGERLESQAKEEEEEEVVAFHCDGEDGSSDPHLGSTGALYFPRARGYSQLGWGRVRYLGTDRELSGDLGVGRMSHALSMAPLGHS